jgi:hypothetical protein
MMERNQICYAFKLLLQISKGSSQNMKVSSLQASVRHFAYLSDSIISFCTITQSEQI